MHVLIVTAVYPPEPVVSALTSAQLADGLRSLGHGVTVVTGFPNRPSGLLFSGFVRRWVQRETSGTGIGIVRCFATFAPESNLASRLIENLSFGVSSALQVLTIRKPDVIYANTWPLFATGILALVARLRSIPLVISVQDVYPEAMVVQQRIPGDGLVARVLRWLDGMIARASAHVIVISARFAQIYRDQRRVRAGQLTVVPNWIDRSQIDCEVPREGYRRQHGLAESDFVLVYGGNIGVAAGVETVITAMRALDDRPDVRLLIAGAGSRLAACRQLAATLAAQQVIFHSPWDSAETSTVLRTADLLVLPTQHQQSLASVPSKLLTYMLSARPVLAVAVPDSDLARLVEETGCGWVVEPNRPDLLAAQIRAIMQLSPAEREQRGVEGRAQVLRYFSSDVCVPQVIQILEQVAKRNRPCA